LALTDSDKLILIAVLVATMTFVLFFELRIMRNKSKESRVQSLKKDEAYNAILTCRSVLNVLERQGTNVREPRALVDKAKEAMLKGDYERAMDLCERARGEMTKFRRLAPTGAKEEDAEISDRERLEEVAKKIVTEGDTEDSGDTYSGTRLTSARGPEFLSAKFELGTAKAEIHKAASSGKDVSKAEGILEDAQAEFDAGNYPKTLSLSVKARKEISTEASKESIRLKTAPPEETEVEEAEEPFAKDRCNACGEPVEPGDAFCGICGAKVQKEVVCPNCGYKPKGPDEFCRKCGAKLS
jgi:hypothetical protein